MLSLGLDSVGSAKDHDTFISVGEVIYVFAYRTSLLGCCLFAVSLLWSAGLSEKTFEELTLLVEVFDRVGVVGAWTIHEFVEVVRQSLMGLFDRAIGRGDQRGVVRPTSILFHFSCPSTWRGPRPGPCLWL